MKLVFATNNVHKLHEIRELLTGKYTISGLGEAGITTEIPEDFPTLEQNASQKAWFIYNSLKLNCFADDTGLEVKSLNGEPGVYSARYSRTGDPVFPGMEITEGNIHKLLLQLRGTTERSARFRTVIDLIIDGEEFSFEGTVNGRITEEPRGLSGFGYDPVFIPDGYDLTFAEMDLSEKNRISHRSAAVRKLIQFLTSPGRIDDKR